MKIWRDRKSGVYHVRFTVSGERQQRSLHTKVKGQADTLAMELFGAAKANASGKESAVTIQKLRELWLEAHGQTASAGHWRNVDTWQSCGLENLPVDRCSTNLVEQARNEFAVGRAPATVNAWLRTLKLLGGYAMNRGMISTLPWRVKMQKVQKSPRKTLPPGKVNEWLAAAEDTAFKSNKWQVGTALRLMIGLGLREQEALGSRWEWLDWGRKLYTVGKAKGYEAREIPVPAWLIAYLEPRKCDLGLILGAKRASGFTRKAIRGANKTLGLQGISAHRLRGTFATIHSEEGTPVQVIQSLLGHKSASTTMLYLESHREKAEEQQEKVAARMGMV